MVYCQNMIDVKYNTYVICIYCNDKHYYIWMQFDLFMVMVGCNIYIMNHGIARCGTSITSICITLLYIVYNIEFSI